ncbi:hypothetical protein DYI37_19585, partial [Fulvimarina endophytica]
MARCYTALLTAFQYRMSGDQNAVLEDLDLVGELVHLHDPATRGVRNAVEVAVDADHAVPTEAALELGVSQTFQFNALVTVFVVFRALIDGELAMILNTVAEKLKRQSK